MGGSYQPQRKGRTSGLAISVLLLVIGLALCATGAHIESDLEHPTSHSAGFLILFGILSFVIGLIGLVISGFGRAVSSICRSGRPADYQCGTPFEEMIVSQEPDHTCYYRSSEVPALQYTCRNDYMPVIDPYASGQGACGIPMLVYPAPGIPVPNMPNVYWFPVRAADGSCLYYSIPYATGDTRIAPLGWK